MFERKTHTEPQQAAQADPKWLAGFSSFFSHVEVATLPTAAHRDGWYAAQAATIALAGKAMGK